MTPEQIIQHLSLTPHPEGGWYKETWRAVDGSGTAIYYLLEAGQRSHWHRVLGSAEIWHFYAGAPLELRVSEDGMTERLMMLGLSLATGQLPQIIVPPDAWQSAEARTGWALVGCTVSPGFDFKHFEIAPPGWRPGPVRTR
jgi:uncharacterized protein